MITLDQMVLEQDGKFVEVAGTANARNQCTDLVNLYIRDVLGLPIIEWTNAVDFPKKAGDKYEYITEDPSFIPKKGDIVIWRGSVGHIAIVLEADINTLTSFDQNYPTGSPCKKVKHTYTGVLGYLRPRPVVKPTTGDFTDNFQVLREVSMAFGFTVQKTLQELLGHIKSREEHIKELEKRPETKELIVEVIVEKEKLVTVEPVFSNKLANLLYEISKQLEGSSKTKEDKTGDEIG